MNPGVQVGPSISAASPPASRTSPLLPTRSTPCPSSPSPAPQTRSTPKYSIISTLQAPTATPCTTTCGPATAEGPARFRTFRVTEPARSLSIGKIWVGHRSQPHLEVAPVKSIQPSIGGKPADIFGDVCFSFTYKNRPGS